MKITQHPRVVCIAALSAVLTTFTTGCSTTGLTWGSLNPFSSSEPNTAAVSNEPQPKVAALQATDTPDVSVDQPSGFTVSAKKAWNSTTNAVTGIFSKNDKEEISDEQVVSDPLSLANQPQKVNAEVYIANGQLWESTGDLGKAMESYTRALQSEPNHGPALSSVARLHFRNQNFSEAATYFRRAVEAQPEEAGLQNDLGLTFSKLGESALAIEHLSKALKLSPGNSRYSNNLASVLFNDQQEQAAMTVLAENNQPAVAHFNMAYLYFQTGKLVQARDHLSEVMKYEVLSTEDVATRRAVERTREMLAGLDRQTPLKTGERIAARPVSHQISYQSDPNSPSDLTSSNPSQAEATPSPSQGVPFALPNGFDHGSNNPQK